MTSDISIPKIYSLFISLFIGIFISLVCCLNVSASEPITNYNINYEEIAERLLSVKGKDTTYRDLYYLSCTVRTHLERNESLDIFLDIFPLRKITPSLRQIAIVKEVVNNNSNKCYDLYIVLPLSMLDADDSYDLITVISNDLAFISYRTFILLTVQPNL